MVDLRERIAAIVGKFDRECLEEYAYGIADALLRELPMHQEHGRLKVHRFVTDWIIDGENNG